MSSTTGRAEFQCSGRAKGRPNSGASARKLGLLRRIIDAVVESDRRRSEREIAGMLARSGGRFTDAMEREAFERHFASNWWPK